MKRTRRAQAALDAWWRRGPLPCVSLGIDPGKMAGATILVSRSGSIVKRLCSPIETYRGRSLEAVIDSAVSISVQEELPLVAFMEDWGAGGPRGLSQWIGLGEARGPWRRELLLRCDAVSRDVLVPKRIGLVRQGRWRSLFVPETGAQTEEGKWRHFEPEEWKVAAQRAAQSHFPDATIPPEDAAESCCIALYGARGDKTVAMLGKRYLQAWGIATDLYEDSIFAT